MEGDAVGVKEIAGERGLVVYLGGCAVEAIADYGMADAGEMHANLMRPAGADADFHKGEAVEAPKHAIPAPGGTAVGQARGHTHALAGIACDGLLDAAAILFH